MKAKPVKLIYGEGYKSCSVEEATHVALNIPGPSGQLYLPIILHGSRDAHDHPVWTWNGNTDAPTLKPSVLTQGGSHKPFRCHSWINDGKAIFLGDSDHEFANQTLDLLEVEDYE